VQRRVKPRLACDVELLVDFLLGIEIGTFKHAIAVTVILVNFHELIFFWKEAVAFNTA
jgi:hypothetical protein